MNKREVAHALRTMGALLQVKGEDSFKVRSYERAADSLEGADYDLRAMAEEGRLTEIPGIGKNLEPKVRDLVLTGRSPFLERLVQEIPEGILDLLRVPGIGPKTARLLHSELGVAGLDDLDRALSEHRVQGLPGMGRKREELMRKGLDEIKKYAGRLSIGVALPVLEDLSATLSDMGVECWITGETRRYEESVASLDLLIREKDGEEPWDVLHRTGVLAALSPAGIRERWDEAAGRFTFATSFGVPLRIFFCPEEGLGLRLAELTGPASFMNAILGAYREKGLAAGSLPRRGGREVGTPWDLELFKAIGATYLPPELRHRGELAGLALSGDPRASQRLDDVVSPQDIRGDLHVHTTWSDGVGTIEEMVVAARKRGYDYIAVTDHATEIKMIRGLTEERLSAQIAEIEELRPKYPDIQILTGVEVDVLRDGRLYLSDEVLSRLDVVVASVHQDVSDSRGELANRLLKVVENPNVDILGHLTGRVIGRRPGVSESLVRVFEAAANNGIALEVNASPERLDLPETLAAEAVSRGARLAVSTDAHRLESLDSMRFGVLSVCRRAAIPKTMIVNSAPYFRRS
ncbi:MAG: PHP domain-containing protein [Bacillota bacterium]